MIRPQRLATFGAIALAALSSPIGATVILGSLVTAGVAANTLRDASPARGQLVTDGGTDLEPPTLVDEWPTECSNPDWSDNCNGDLETNRERKKGLCEGCMAVIRSWSGDDDDGQGDDGTEQTTLVTDGGVDSFESQMRRATFRCTECDDFELEKFYSGLAGTPGEEEYDRIEAPETCPACGGDVERTEDR